MCLCAGACGGGIGHTHGGFLRPGYVFVTTDEPTDNLIREWRGVGGEEKEEKKEEDEEKENGQSDTSMFLYLW